MDLKHRNKQENVLYSAAFQLVIMVQRLGLFTLAVYCQITKITQLFNLKAKIGQHHYLIVYGFFMSFMLCI